MSKPTYITKMGIRQNYEDENTLLDHLAGHLMRGTLTVALGAGASFGFCLPDWDELIRRLFKNVDRTNPTDVSNQVAAEILLRTSYSDDRIQFAEAVRIALYDRSDLSLQNLRQNNLLSALGALTMVSSRGSAAHIISFNYDDLLELYLKFFGYDVATLSEMPNWANPSDIQVLHPHGFLPSDPSVNVENPIILTQEDYDEVVGDRKDSWRNALVEVLNSHICLFIGLSGKDPNLTNILSDVNKTHINKREGGIYWGIRLGLDNDEMNGIWEARGVFSKGFADYKMIPDFIFEICQRAAKLKNESRRILG